MNQHLRPQRQRRTIRGMFAGMLFLLAMVCGLQASATHFRYGNITWQHDATYTGPGYKIIFKVTESWRRGFQWYSYGFQDFGTGVPNVGDTIRFYSNFMVNFGDLSTPAQQKLVVTDIVPNGGPTTDIVNGEFITSHVYNTAGSFLAYFEGAARLSGPSNGGPLMNNGDGSFRVESMVTTGNGNDAPVSTMPPIINMVVGQTAATYMIPATDPNGDQLNFSLAPPSSFTQTGFSPANTQPFPTFNPNLPPYSTNLSISSGGQLNFNTSGLVIGQLYNAVVRVTDARGGYVHLDFLIRISGPSTAPVFESSTPANNTAYTVAPGQNLSFTVGAHDPDPGDNVTLFGNSVPQGASTSPALPVTGPATTTTTPGIASTSFNWTPVLSQTGSYVINFIAQDPQGVQASRNMFVTVQCNTKFTYTTQDIVCGAPGRITVTPTTTSTPPFQYSSDGGATWTAGGSSYTFNGLIAGTYNVQVKGGNGCVASQPVTITTVADNAAPTINCPQNITVDADPNVCGAVVSYNVTATDNCAVCGPSSIPGFTYLGTFGGHKYFRNNNSYSWYNANYYAQINGAHLATISSAAENAFISTAAGGNGAYAWIGFTDEVTEGSFVWVNGEPVTYTNWCSGEPNNLGNEDYTTINWCAGGGWNDLPYYSLLPSIIEFDCADASTGLGPHRLSGPPSGSVFPVGTTTVKYEASDPSNNTVACSFTVTVKDKQAPTINNLPGNRTANNDAGVCGAAVSWTAPTSSDNCTGSTITQVAGPASGSVFPVGTTTVSYKAMDAAGNSTTQGFTVTVMDNEAPAITGPAGFSVCNNDLLNNPSNTYSLTATAADNCHVASVTYTITGGTTSSGTAVPGGSDTYTLTENFGVGTSIITWFAKDDTGNPTTTTTTVTILPSPTVSIANVATYCNHQNTIYLGYGPQSVTLTANGGGSGSGYTYSWTVPPSTFSTANTNVVSPTSTTTYTVTVKDGAGCMAAAQKTIQVKDVRCGNHNDKVQVCHNGNNALCISPNAVPAHMNNHGDCLGDCTNAFARGTKTNQFNLEGGGIAVFPNPAHTNINVQLQDVGAIYRSYEITDISGRVVISKQLSGDIRADLISVDISGLVPGIYVIRAITDDGTNQAKFTVE